MKTKPRKNMTNFNNYYCLVLLLIFITKTCTTDEIKVMDLESSASDDDSGSEDSSSSGLDIDEGVCNLPIAPGDCEAKSLENHESGLSDNAIKELYEINDMYEVKELYEISQRYGLKQLNKLNNELKDHNELRSRYFGYNRSTEKCEEFDYDGCGGNDNRFVTLKKCKKTCYTPLKYFLSEVTDLLLFKFKEYYSEAPTT